MKIESIIKKYGSLDAYYKQRNEKLRKTALNRCQTEEERQKKLKNLNGKIFWRQNLIKIKLEKTALVKDVIKYLFKSFKKVKNED